MATLPYPLGHKLESTPAQVRQKALALNVVLTVAGGKLHAAGDRDSVQELAPLLRQHRDDLVHLLTNAANDPAPDLRKPEPAHRRITLVPGTTATSTPVPAPDQYGANTVPAPASKQPSPGWLHMDQPWRAADRLYQDHHGQCPTCKATATGHSDRCTAGQHLHDTYNKAAMAAMNRSTT